jgi:low affinity Fe/Cu permease
MQEIFRRLAHKSATLMGSSLSFMAALGLILAWLLSGPLFHFSDTWQLVINTSTTIITFLMVFLIQNTQNRDSHALHLKLDELIRSNKQARNRLLALEDLSDAEMQALQLEFEQLRDRKSEVPASRRSAPVRPSLHPGPSRGEPQT